MNPLLQISVEKLIELGVCDWGYTENENALSFDQFIEWTKLKESQCLPYLLDERAEKRENLKKIFPSFQSALVFHFSYAQIQKTLKNMNANEIAGYALAFEGHDYHLILRERLFSIINLIKDTVPGEMKSTLDIEPLLERDLSFRAGLGWFGKNSMLISQKEGSYFLIGSLLLSQKLNILKQQVQVDHCGNCDLCISACPTNAIDVQTRTIKASLCLSTYTIEIMKEAIPPEGAQLSRGEIFGCDICQDICPWNKKKLGTISQENLSQKSKDLMSFFNRSKEEILSDLSSWSGKAYQRYFAQTPISRPGLKGMLKNIKFLKHSR